MKVLKPGREQKGWAVELECTGFGNGDGGCGAKLLVEEGDLFTRVSRIAWKCVCGVLTDLETEYVNKLASHLMTLVMNRQAPPGAIESRLTIKEFETLLEYSGSYPTSLLLGKRWKAERNGSWWLAEVVPDPRGELQGPDLQIVRDEERCCAYVGIRWRKLEEAHCEACNSEIRIMRAP